MNLKEKVRKIYYEECSNPQKYSKEELQRVSRRVNLLKEIKNNHELIEIIGEVAKEAETGLTHEQIIKAKKSDQKFINMSGNLYEYITEQENNDLLKESKSNTKFYFPKELKNKIEKNKILNNEKDIEMLENWIKGKTFDLYLLRKENNGYTVFGVVQCKKSVRERIGRDREPSINAIKNGFFSILISSNDDSLGKEKTKMREMFFGEGKHFDKKGWDFGYFENLFLATKNIKDKKFMLDDIKRAEKMYKK